MTQQLNISDPTTGMAYKKVNETETSMRYLIGKRINEEVEGDDLGFEGYVFKIRGGADKEGFPMTSSVQGGVRRTILTSGGVGFRPLRERNGVRKKKRVRGDTINEDVYQINLVIVKKGEKKIEELLATEK